MIKVNNSLMKLLRDCETKAYLRWGRELVMSEHSGPGPMEVGRVCHRIMEGWYQKEVPDFEPIWAEECGQSLPTQERLYPGNVKHVLNYWMDAQAIQNRQLSVSKTEQTLEAHLGCINNEEVIYYGTIDALVVWSGGIWVMDHKTTGNMGQDWERQWQMSAQMIGYTWLARQCGYPVRGAVINGLEIRKLPPWDGNFSKKCAVHKLKYQDCQGMHVNHAFIGPLTWSERRMNQWKYDVLHMARRLMMIRDAIEEGREGTVLLQRGLLQSVKQDGQFTWPGCSRCQYQAFCQADRPLESLERMMSHESWMREEKEEE